MDHPMTGTTVPEGESTRRHRFLRDEDGAVTIPALFWIVFYLFVLFSAIDMAVVFTKQVLLDRATEATGRIVRLSLQPKVDEEVLRNSICRHAGFFGKDCLQRVSVETFSVDKTNWSSSIDNHPLRCVDFSDTDNPPPAATLEGGAPNQLVLMRVCLRVKPMMIDDFFAQAMLSASPLNTPGEFALVSTTAFVIEPNSGAAAASPGS